MALTTPARPSVTSAPARRRATTTVTRRRLATTGVFIGLLLGAVFAAGRCSGCCRARSSRTRRSSSCPRGWSPETFSFDAYISIFTNPETVRFFINSYRGGRGHDPDAARRHPGGLRVQPVRVPRQAHRQRHHRQRPGGAADHAAESVLRAHGRTRAVQHLAADLHLHGVHAALRDHHDDGVLQHPAQGARRSRPRRRRGSFTALWRVLVPISIPASCPSASTRS